MDYKKFLAIEGEKPLERMVPGGGLTKIFKTIGCIGDSLSSGEFQSYSDDYGSGYHDDYHYSWGQYMAREAGTNVFNFSKGGMTAKEFLASFGVQCGCWNPENVCQAYIIALGVNDLFNRGYELGDVNDCDERNLDTFSWNYGRIIKRIKQNQPKAKIFLMTMPRDVNEEKNKIRKDHADLLYQFKEKFENIYIIDLFKDACVYDDEFRNLFFLDGHMNAAGYILTAEMVMSYIDYIVRHNMEEFVQVPFIGKPYYNSKYKW